MPGSETVASQSETGRCRTIKLSGRSGRLRPESRIRPRVSALRVPATNAKPKPSGTPYSQNLDAARIMKPMPRATRTCCTMHRTFRASDHDRCSRPSTEKPALRKTLKAVRPQARRCSGPRSLKGNRPGPPTYSLWTDEGFTEAGSATRLRWRKSVPVSSPTEADSMSSTASISPSQSAGRYRTMKLSGRSGRLRPEPRKRPRVSALRVPATNATPLSCASPRPQKPGRELAHEASLPPLAKLTQDLSPTGSTVSSRHESPAFAFDAMAYGLVDDHALQKNAGHEESKPTSGLLKTLSLFVAPVVSCRGVGGVENRLSSTGSTVSSGCESWPFAYSPMAYGLVEDHSLQDAAGNGSHSQHLNTGLLLFSLCSVGECIPLQNPSNDSAGCTENLPKVKGEKVHYSR